MTRAAWIVCVLVVESLIVMGMFAAFFALLGWSV